jgi:hypothetical protein
MIPEDKTRILRIDLYLGVQQHITHTLDASIFVDSMTNGILHLKGSTKSERPIELIEFTKSETRINSRKITKCPTPYTLYPNQELGLVALWFDDGMLQVFKVKTNALIAIAKIGDDGSALSTLRIVEKNLLLVVIDKSKVLILRVEEMLHTPSVYLNLSLASPIHSEAVYYFENKGLLVIINHQLYFEAYKISLKTKLHLCWLRNYFQIGIPLTKHINLRRIILISQNNMYAFTQ